MTSALKDILYLYFELIIERDNYSGHYEGNAYQAITIFAEASFYSGDFDPLQFMRTEIKHASDYETPVLKNGAVIKILCILSETISDALLHEYDEVDSVTEKQKSLFDAFDRGDFNWFPPLAKAMKLAREDAKAFNNELIDIFNSLVMPHYAELTNKGTGLAKVHPVL